MATPHTLNDTFGHSVIRAQNESSVLKVTLGLHLDIHWGSCKWGICKPICLDNEKSENNNYFCNYSMFGGIEMTRFSIRCK